jgi:predicted nucleic acid-binding protein
MFEPRTAVTDCRDPTDNKYLELALEARARTIISSDADLLVLSPWRSVAILTPAEYLAATAS